MRLVRLEPFLSHRLCSFAVLVWLTVAHSPNRRLWQLTAFVGCCTYGSPPTVFPFTILVDAVEGCEDATTSLYFFV
jgi:hypothetical protein